MEDNFVLTDSNEYQEELFLKHKRKFLEMLYRHFSKGDLIVIEEDGKTFKYEVVGRIFINNSYKTDKLIIQLKSILT